MRVKKSIAAHGRMVLFALLMGFFAQSYSYANDQLSMQDDRVRICLTMTVKDDADSILSVLESVKGIIDCVSICDLGSNDWTAEIIEDFLHETGIPGKVYRNVLLNMGQKNLSLELAKRTLKRFNFSFQHTYLFVINTGIKLIVTPSFDKDALKDDLYFLLNKTPSLFYSTYSAHLFRASLTWQNSGVVTEQWSCSQPYQSSRLHSLVLDEYRNNEKKIENMTRDIQLISSLLNEDPQNQQYLLYLAQANRYLYNYDVAIEWNKAIIKNGGNKEEVWLAMFMIGDCYEEMGNWEQAIPWYLNAYQFYPDRTESLRKMATYYRLRGQNELAYMFAKHGVRIPLPENQNYFPLPPLYDYQFDEELSVVSFYTRFKDDGYAASNDVMLRRNVPWFIKEQTAKNLLFYVHKLENAHYQPISIDLPQIEQGFDERYHPMNPSILKTEHGYKLNLRAVNYTQIGAKEFNTIDSSGIFRTKNFLVDFDKDFNFLSQKEIVENLKRERKRAFSVEGLEDCRLVEFNNRTWFTCSTLDTNPFGNIEISLCRLPEQATGRVLNVEKLTPLIGPDRYRCEKNWLPFVKDGVLYVIYSQDPFIVYKPNTETGECEMVVYHKPTADFSRFRGSAAPIEFDGGYLMLVHEVVYQHDFSRSYMHRYLYLDRNFVVQKVSKPFIFFHNGIEYCCSMVLDHSGTQLVMPIGIEDREAYICKVDLNTVRSMLLPLPAITPEPAFQSLN